MSFLQPLRGAWPLLFLIPIAIVVSNFAKRDATRDAVAEANVAKFQAKAEAESAKWAAEEAEISANVESDIAKCSTVTDAIRCQRAFRCFEQPAQCVMEHGDPQLVLDMYYERREEGYRAQ